jgi:hypothetical protein
MRDAQEGVKEMFLLTPFLNGMWNRNSAVAIEALQPLTLEDAPQLAKKEEKCGNDGIEHVKSLLDQSHMANSLNVRTLHNQHGILDSNNSGIHLRGLQNHMIPVRILTSEPMTLYKVTRLGVLERYENDPMVNSIGIDESMFEPDKNIISLSKINCKTYL